MPDRPSIIPDLPAAPAPIAPRAEALPAPPPVAQVSPSGRPAVTPLAVQLVDRIGDIVGVIVIGHLCGLGKLGGIEAAIVIGAILGVGTGLRQAGARAGVAPGLSVLGLLVLGVGRWLAPAAGAAELARVSGMFGLLGLLVLGAAGALPTSWTVWRTYSSLLVAQATQGTLAALQVAAGTVAGGYVLTVHAIRATGFAVGPL